MQNKQFEAALSIILVLVAFALYLIFAKSRFARKMAGLNGEQSFTGVKLVVLQKLAGAFLFSILPFVAIKVLPERNISEFGLFSTDFLREILYALPFLLIILPLHFFNSRSESHLKVYPQFRLNRWSFGSVLLTSLTWTAYLIGYEFLFRGYLLFTCLDTFSVPVAIIINLILYSIVHIPKGLKEILGSIPMGIVLCLLVIRFESIWVAVFLHMLLALSNEYFSISAHPDMIFSRKKSRAA